MRMTIICAAIFALMPAGAAMAQTASGETAQVEQVFSAQDVAARAAAVKTLEASDTPIAKYTVGAHRFFGGLERFGQAFHRHGFETPQSMMLPLFRLPVPDNASPEPLTYDGFRAILAQFHADMAAAAAGLAEVPAGEDFGVEVDLAKLGIDMNSDGAIGDDETIAGIIGQMSGPGGGGPVPPGALAFRFDRADGIWLRGYANFLAAQADFWLAHDFRMAFDNSFHMFFPRAGLPLQDILVPTVPGSMLQSEWRLADLVSLIHYVNWPVVEPERRQRAREELLEMVRLSRENWKAIRAETDNQREWLPGPQQSGVQPLTGLEVGEAEVKAWHDALDVAESLLEGRLLLPHFRFTDMGMDMKAFLAEPKPFDLVTTITGPGAVPYLVKGDILNSDQFWQLSSQFGRGGFMSYAIWFN